MDSISYEAHKEELDRLKFQHEGEVSRLEVHNKRNFVLTLIVFFALIATNICWIVYENSYVDNVTITQDTPNGNNNYIGHNGDITNGTSNDNQGAP